MAYPVTTVIWRKDGKPLRDDANHIHIEPANGTLKISSVVSSDRGEYVCLVNTTGFNPVLSKPAHIQVKGTNFFNDLLVYIMPFSKDSNYTN